MAEKGPELTSTFLKFLNPGIPKNPAKPNQVTSNNYRDGQHRFLNSSLPNYQKFNKDRTNSFRLGEEREHGGGLEGAPNQSLKTQMGQTHKKTFTGYIHKAKQIEKIMDFNQFSMMANQPGSKNGMAFLPSEQFVPRTQQKHASLNLNPLAGSSHDQPSTIFYNPQKEQNRQHVSPKSKLVMKFRGSQTQKMHNSSTQVPAQVAPSQKSRVIAAAMHNHSQMFPGTMNPNPNIYQSLNQNYQVWHNKRYQLWNLEYIKRLYPTEFNSTQPQSCFQRTPSHIINTPTSHEILHGQHHNSSMVAITDFDSTFCNPSPLPSQQQIHLGHRDYGKKKTFTHPTSKIPSSKSQNSLIINPSNSLATHKLKVWVACTPSNVVMNYLQDTKCFTDFRMQINNFVDFIPNLKHPYLFTEHQEQSPFQTKGILNKRTNELMVNDLIQIKNNIDTKANEIHFNLWKEQLANKLQLRKQEFHRQSIV